MIPSTARQTPRTSPADFHLKSPGIRIQEGKQMKLEKRTVLITPQFPSLDTLINNAGVMRNLNLKSRTTGAALLLHCPL